MASSNLKLDAFFPNRTDPTAPAPPLGRGGGPSFGQTPFGGYELQPGLSPEERRSLEISIDSGVSDRIRRTQSIAPSVRQQTQGEVINLTMLYERLGNPFSVRRIPFSVLRDMVTDPMINFALYFTKIPLVRADWYIESPDAQLAAAVDAALRPVNSSLQTQICGKLAYGYQPMCKRFKLGELRGFYRDPNGEDPEKDIPIWDSKEDALLWDKPYVLAPEHCMPRWNERGDFDGFYYSIVPLPNPIQIGIANLYGYSVVPGFEVGTEFAMWPVNEIDDNFGSLFGSPRTKRAYRYFWSYWYRWALADRSFENLADPVKRIYYPTEYDQVIDPNDPDLANGTEIAKHVQARALSLGQQMRAGATLALPGDFAKDANGNPTSQRLWDADYIEAKGNFAELSESFGYLDSLKFRCVTADTPVDCPRDHRRFPEGVPISMLKSGDPVWTFNLMTLKFELSRVKAAMMTQASQPVFRVRLSNGREIRGTANHPFLTTDLHWKQLGELAPGDLLIEFRRDFEPHVKLDPASYSGCRQLEYHSVAELMGIRGEGKKLHAHHIDTAHANTAAENLQGVTAGEHHVLERTGRRWGAETRRRQSESRIRITQEERDRRALELQAADDLLLRDYLAIPERICIADGCKSKPICRGLCRRCYGNARYQLQVHDVPLPPKDDQKKRVYGIHQCSDCGRDFLKRAGGQRQCQACRAEFTVEENRRWRERSGHIDETTGRLMGSKSGSTPTFEELCDAITVIAVDFDGIEDVWDVAIDAPDERKNFISGGVVLHNSMLVPEQAFISGQKGATGGTGSGSSSRLMGVQLGEVYQQSQQLLAEENDAEINRDMIPQWIAANFPDKAGTPCRKVTRGFGAYDTELIKQIIQLVGQVKGSILPVDIREMLRQAGMPLLTEKQQKQQEEQIAEEAAKMQPAPTAPQRVGMQGYNAGVEKTPQGLSVYVQPPERIDLSTLHHEGLLGSLPEVPAYKDASIRASMMKLRKMMLDRYKQRLESFIEHVGGQTSLHLAAQAAPQDVTTVDQSQPGATTPPQQPPPSGLSPAQAAGVAGAIISAWMFAQGADDAQGAVSGTLLAIANRGALRELKLANLGNDALDIAVIEDWAKQRASFVVDSIDSTIQDELKTFLTNELQKRTSPEDVAQAARQRFEDTAQTHADRVVLTETLPAYNHGALTAFQSTGVGQVMAHDASNGRNQLTDSECLKRNGKIMSVDQALGVAAEVHPHDTLWFSPLSTDNFTIERVDTLPSRLNGRPNQAAAYDRDKEVLFVLSDVNEEDEQEFTLAIGSVLQMR